MSKTSYFVRCTDAGWHDDGDTFSTDTVREALNAWLIQADGIGDVPDDITVKALVDGEHHSTWTYRDDGSKREFLPA